MRKKERSVTDLFCGAGGSSTGAKMAGAYIQLGLNHDKLAVQTHNTNFPDAFHEVCDISASNPRRYISTDILIASPECTNMSGASGKKRNHQKQLNFFERGIDPHEIRSRATMWDVPRFAEHHRYNMIVVEQVCDARKWEMWDAWLHAMQCLGYEWKIVYFNSMHAWPTPQSRDRMYTIFWRRGNRKPNLDFHPPAYCKRCEKNVESVQAWKNPNKQHGKYGPRQQYVYNCPKCNCTVEPYYFAAATAIDWSLNCEKLKDRKRELKPETVERIKYGLNKFLGNPLLVETAFSHAGPRRVIPDTIPFPTQTTRQTHALAVPPFLMGLHTHCSYREVHEAMTTVVAEGNHHFLVKPFIGTHNRTQSLRPVDGPMHTIATENHEFILMPPNAWILDYKDNPMRPITEPASTLTAHTTQHYLVSYYGGGGVAHDIKGPIPTIPTVDRHALVESHFLSRQYSGHDHSSPLTSPTGTVTATDHHALVKADFDISEVGFRMLQPHELQAAMAFPADYKVLGNQRQKVKQLGNAVTPPVMRMILERCIEAL